MNEVEELKKLLRWAVNEIDDMQENFPGREETPYHECQYTTRPDLGKCEFHDNYWRSREILGTIPEGDDEEN